MDESKSTLCWGWGGGCGERLYVGKIAKCLKTSDLGLYFSCIKDSVCMVESMAPSLGLEETMSWYNGFCINDSPESCSQ